MPSRGERTDLSTLPAEVHWLDSTPSTNDYLSQQEPAEGVRIALSWAQTRGRGRLGRTWVSPAGQSLALSVDLGPLVPEEPTEAWRGALPLIIASELAEAITTAVSVPAVVKWPNDVLIDGRKVAGILGEIPGPRRVIMGIGLNVWGVPTGGEGGLATALSEHGLQDTEQFDGFLRDFLESVLQRIRSIRTGVSEQDWAFIRSHLSTVGKDVMVQVPDGSTLRGMADGLDGSGRLIVTTTSGSQSISAGDIEHLRTT